MSRQRLEEKLGWLRDFADGIARWPDGQTVISITLTFLNQQGLFEGVATAYQTLTAGLGACPASQQLAADRTALLTDDESQ